MDLLSCPFCGSINVSSCEALFRRDTHYYRQTGCVDCGALGPAIRVAGPREGHEQVNEAWNTRVVPPVVHLYSPAPPLPRHVEEVLSAELYWLANVASRMETDRCVGHARRKILAALHPGGEPSAIDELDNSEQNALRNVPEQ